MKTTQRVQRIVTVFALPFLAACAAAPDDQPLTPERAVVRLSTQVVNVTELERTIDTTGTIEPWMRVSPGTKILGRVQQVPVREGDAVRKGQLLAALEKTDLEAGVAQAEAGRRVAEVTLENAQRHRQRMLELHGRGSATEKSLEDATAAFHIAEAHLDRARADLSAAEVLLDFAEVRAPLTGRIRQRIVEVGDMVAPGAPMFALEDLSRVKILLTVPESQAVGLREGEPATVHVDALQQSWDAVVDRILPAADPGSRTFAVQLMLENPDGRLRSGMFVRASFSKGSRPALVVPSTAVVDRGSLRGLFVVAEDGQARLRWVRLGEASEAGVEVLSGLVDGERVVVAPPTELLDGTPVAES